MYNLLNYMKNLMNKFICLNLSNMMTKFNEFLNLVIMKIQTNKFKIFMMKIKDFSTKIFNMIMFNYIYKLFTNMKFLTFYIIFFMMIMFFLLFSNSGYNMDILKLYFCVFVLNLFVLRFLILDFEKTKYMQNLNLIFLYVNLVFFFLFFFSDFEFLFFKLMNFIQSFF